MTIPWDFCIEYHEELGLRIADTISRRSDAEGEI